MIIIFYFLGGEKDYYLLPWDGTLGDVNDWLQHHGYER